MAENSSRSKLVKAMKSLDAKPIESHMRAGTPDINFIGGWMEVKYMAAWPKDADTKPVRLTHALTKEQGIWLWRRSINGGTALMVLHVGREWLFFDGIDVKEYMGKATRQELRMRAVLRFEKSLDSKKLIQWLLMKCRG